jgi:hypothetical protein
MDLKKVALSIALMTSLAGVHAGCGDDPETTGAGGGVGGGAGGGTPIDVNFPTPNCGGGAGDEAPVDFGVTSVFIPDTLESEAPGFDLDDEDDACDIDDFDGSVDNGLAYMRSFLDLATSMSDPPYQNINLALDAAIEAEEFVVTMTGTGWNGTDDDECVLIGLDTGTFGDSVVDAPAIVEDGILYVVFPDAFGLSIPIAGTEANLSIHSGRATFDVNTGEGVLGGVVDRGTADDYTAEAAAELPEGTLHRTIHDVIAGASETIQGAATDELVNMALGAGSDSESSDEVACAAISVGFSFTTEEL